MLVYWLGADTVYVPICNMALYSDVMSKQDYTQQNLMHGNKLYLLRPVVHGYLNVGSAY